MAKDDPGRVRRQFGAVPFTRTADQALRVLLLTSRETRRWVIPKGWPMHGRSGPEVALQEAYEEAGLRGRITGGGVPLGVYEYDKQLSPDKLVRCSVKVYRMRVHRELAEWPERDQRERGWFDPLEAAALVLEPGLAAIFRSIAERPKLDRVLEAETTGA